MSSDSSDDEDLNKLREAADSQFINDSMFNKKSAKKHSVVEKLPSLRHCKDEDEQFNLFQATPEFRNHIGKHLSTMLDAVLQKKLIHKTNFNYTEPKRRKSGIKLFHNSLSHIRLKTKDKPSQLVTKRQGKEPSEDENDDKFKSVAVNPDEILSQKETKHWSTRSKAPVYTYIETKHGLILK